jgi:hypothetical protein
MQIDNSVCNVASGITSAHLEKMGFIRGQDYKLRSGMMHSFIEFSNGKIYDATFAQFFIKGSKSHQAVVKGLDGEAPSNGFYGTYDELMEYLWKNRDDVSEFKNDQNMQQYYSNCENPKREDFDKFPPEKCIELTKELFKNRMTKLYYGDKVDGNAEFNKSALIPATMLLHHQERQDYKDLTTTINNIPCVDQIVPVCDPLDFSPSEKVDALSSDYYRMQVHLLFP